MVCKQYGIASSEEEASQSGSSAAAVYSGGHSRCLLLQICEALPCSVLSDHMNEQMMQSFSYFLYF